MELHTIGIDIGKRASNLVGLSVQGEVVVRKKFSRKQLLHSDTALRLFRNSPSRIIKGMDGIKVALRVGGVVRRGGRRAWFVLRTKFSAVGKVPVA